MVPRVHSQRAWGRLAGGRESVPNPWRAMHCAQLTVYLGSGCSYGAALDRHRTELGQRPPFFTEAQRLEGSDLPTPSPCRGLPVSFLASLGKPLPQKGASPRHNILCVSVCMFLCVACVCAFMWRPEGSCGLSLRCCPLHFEEMVFHEPGAH